jgi:tripartite-type tricarboxylate transporter receptor subunit TctC
MTDTRITRRAALALPAALAAPAVHAQGTQPFGFGGNITIVVPFPAGGQSDLLARLIAERIGPLLGRTVVVENLTGAGGQIAARNVQGARADGSRLLLANTSVIVLTPMTTPNPGYDPATGFAPVAGAGEFAAALATGPMTGAQDLAALTAWLRANPNQANAGVPALGSLPHLTALSYGAAADVAIQVVPYRGGAPIAADLMGGQLAVGVAGAADFASLHQGGRLRIVGVTGTRRAPGLPDVPTFAEAGVRGLEANAWSGLYAPAGTPAPAIAALHGAVVRSFAEPEVQRRLEAVGIIPVTTDPAGLTGWMTRDQATFRPLLQRAGLLVG